MWVVCWGLLIGVARGSGYYVAGSSCWAGGLRFCGGCTVVHWQPRGAGPVRLVYSSTGRPSWGGEAGLLPQKECDAPSRLTGLDTGVFEGGPGSGLSAGLFGGCG